MESVPTRADRDDLGAEVPHRGERMLAQHGSRAEPAVLRGHGEDRDAGISALGFYGPGHVTGDGTVDLSDRDVPVLGGSWSTATCLT